MVPCPSLTDQDTNGIKEIVHILFASSIRTFFMLSFYIIDLVLGIFVDKLTNLGDYKEMGETVR